MGNRDAHAYALSVAVAPNGEKIEPYEKLVLLVLAHHASPDEGHCWAKGSTIAAETCLHASRVSRALTSLEAKNVISSVRQLRGGIHVWDVLHAVRSAPADLNPDVFAFAPVSKAEADELLHQYQKQPTKRVKKSDAAFAPVSKVLLHQGQNPIEAKEETDTHASQRGARLGSSVQPTNDRGMTISDGARFNPSGQGSTAIQLPPTSAKPTERILPAPTEPAELAPYLQALNSLRSVGPLTGARNTPNTRDRRLREAQRLYGAKVPATALVGFDRACEEAGQSYPDPFRDGKAVDWAIAQFGAPDAKPGNKPTVADRFSNIRRMREEQRNGGTAIPAEGVLPGAEQLPGSSVRRLPAPVSRQLPG
jgi:helix-turn-helix protein